MPFDRGGVLLDGVRVTDLNTALTLSAALGLPFVRAATNHVSMDEIGRWTQDESGTALRLRRSADSPSSIAWL